MTARETASEYVATTSPFHAGERAVQRRMGVSETIEPWARKVIRSYLTDQHRDFFAESPFLVAAARDAGGRPWVTLLTGDDAFIRSPDPRQLHIQTQLRPGDALEGALRAGAELGLLGIDLASRRRNRVNGRLTESDRSGMLFEVGQSFGNCPQHIRQRTLRRVTSSRQSCAVNRTSELTEHMRRWIQKVDTLFIASGYSDNSDEAVYGMDASHRGGPAGFVKIESASRLTFPDYAGNNHFNTVGNITMDSRVGLLFVDFEHGNMLQLTGNASIDWGSTELARHPGAQRLIVFTLEQAVELSAAIPLRWSTSEASARPLELIEKVVESDDVVSFTFAARDGLGLPPFEAGQHLPIELSVPGISDAVTRTYSLSNAPTDNSYRISVKREPNGIASNYLIDDFSVGDCLTSTLPGGDFVLDQSARPVVLLSAGIGITPMVAMLYERARQSQEAPIWFLHGTRDGAHQPLQKEVRALTANHSNIRSTIAFSQPREVDEPGRDYDVEGRIDSDLLDSQLPEISADFDADFYLCGPLAFLSDVQSHLESRGVPEQRIHSETFGSN